MGNYPVIISGGAPTSTTTVQALLPTFQGKTLISVIFPENIQRVRELRRSFVWFNNCLCQLNFIIVLFNEETLYFVFCFLTQTNNILYMTRS